MATSGSTNFTINRDELIKASMRLCGVGLDGETLSAEDMSAASQALNMMAKAWQADGLNLWKQQRVTLFFELTKHVYKLGLTGDHVTLESDVAETTFRVAGVATDTTLEVGSTTGMAVADNIGLVLDSGALQWTTIATIPDSDTLTISAGLTSAAAIGNEIYTYTNKIDRPLRIIDAWIRDKFNNDTELQHISRDTYYLLGTKSAAGRPVELYYDPQLVNGVLNVFPEPSNVTETLEMVCHLPVEDFDVTEDTPDFPQEWYEALKFGLAVRLGPEYGLPQARLQGLVAMSSTIKERVMGFDVEDTSLYLRPNQR